ncbi:MAG: polysaccharide deacetylase family protein [Anaerolineae bacterium]|nr:polysaccharide deacetylase family protein [Anaerolineae bacterium]
MSPRPLTRRQFVTVVGALGVHWLAARSRSARARGAAAMPGHVPVYLTFDDGVETEGAKGERGPTLDVLDLLAERGIVATFFVHGRNTGDAEGTVLARMLRAGHRIGNHLFHQGGATLDARPAPSYLARLYLDTELRIREVLAPYQEALALFLAQPRLFRRPGGGYDSAEGNLFLLADGGYWDSFLYERELAAYRHLLDWLRDVYDYSGWHVNPLPLWEQRSDPEAVVWRAIDGPGGLRALLQPVPDKPHLVAQCVQEGVIVLLHDPDPRVIIALPALLDALDTLGAAYHVLPRPGDLPNRYTVGIARPEPLVIARESYRDVASIP